ncbi:hypothetical protein CPB86DRAFT_778633 [Serendipita vermifera]|nr:hypothetical protein CPB86DRAFT_778633 [Serendipita vermifera]
MGLAARKEKQRIGADPRNLKWSEDKSRFGQQYLAKFGWTPESGAGLGANGDGRLKHISVVQKLNLLGIGNGQGMGSLNNPDAIAYKQNNDFERMLKRLNQGGDPSEVQEEREKEERDERVARIIRQGFVPADKTDAEHAGVQPQQEEEDVEMFEADKKMEKERRREEKRKKKLLKQQKEPAAEEPSTSISQSQLESDSPAITPPVVAVPNAVASKPRMAHRAKFRASKQLASLSSTALSEILGVSSSVSTSAAPSHMATPPLLPPDLQNPEDDMPSNTPEIRKSLIIEEQLTTSSTSMADYFAAKLKARKAQMAEAMDSTPTNEIVIQEDSTVQAEGEESTRRSEKREKKKEKKRKRQAKEMEVDETDPPGPDTPNLPLQEKEERLLDEELLKKRKKKRKQDA